MANSNRPYGFRPVNTLDGSPNNKMVKKYLVTDNTAIFIGDTVLLDAGVGGGQLNAGDPYYPACLIAAADSAVAGVCVGIEPLPTDLSINYHKASTDMYIYVNTDPDTIYSVQGDSGVWAVEDIGLNATITVGAGSTVTGRSTTVITGPSADAALGVLIVGVDPAPDNTTGAYMRLLVKLNLHQFGTAIAGQHT